MRTMLKNMGASALIALVTGAVAPDATADTSLALSIRPIELTAKSDEELRADLESILRQVQDFSRQQPYRYTVEKIRYLEMGEDYVYMEFTNFYTQAPPQWRPERYEVSFRFERLPGMFKNNMCLDELPDGVGLGILTSRWNEFWPVFCNITYTLGVRAQRQHDVDQARFTRLAREQGRAANTASPEDVRRLVVQAEALRQDRRYATAAATYRKVIRLAPVSFPTAYLNLALLYEIQGDYPGAIESMQRYLILQPKAPDARAAQDKIYEWEMRAARR